MYRTYQYFSLNKANVSNTFQTRVVGIFITQGWRPIVKVISEWVHILRWTKLKMACRNILLSSKSVFRSPSFIWDAITIATILHSYRLNWLKAMLVCNSRQIFMINSEKCHFILNPNRSYAFSQSFMSKCKQKIRFDVTLSQLSCVLPAGHQRKARSSKFYFLRRKCENMDRTCSF